jgi:hypothetical protein
MISVSLDYGVMQEMVSDSTEDDLMGHGQTQIE